MGIIFIWFLSTFNALIRLQGWRAGRSRNKTQSSTLKLQTVTFIQFSTKTSSSSSSFPHPPRGQMTLWLFAPFRRQFSISTPSRAVLLCVFGFELKATKHFQDFNEAWNLKITRFWTAKVWGLSGFKLFLDFNWISNTKLDSFQSSQHWSCPTLTVFELFKKNLIDSEKYQNF